MTNNTTPHSGATWSSSTSTHSSNGTHDVEGGARKAHRRGDGSRPHAGSQTRVLRCSRSLQVDQRMKHSKKQRAAQQWAATQALNAHPCSGARLQTVTWHQSHYNSCDATNPPRPAWPPETGTDKAAAQRAHALDSTSVNVNKISKRASKPTTFYWSDTCAAAAIHKLMKYKTFNQLPMEQHSRCR